MDEAQRQKRDRRQQRGAQAAAVVGGPLDCDQLDQRDRHQRRGPGEVRNRQYRIHGAELGQVEVERLQPGPEKTLAASE